jgi:hypothetical protein
MGVNRLPLAAPGARFMDTTDRCAVCHDRMIDLINVLAFALYFPAGKSTGKVVRMDEIRAW